MLFALPMMAGNLLQQIYNIADTMIVGRYIGSDALAAVGSSYTLMTFLTSLIIGLCMGSGALFSKSFGAGDLDEMKQNIVLSFFFIGAVTLMIYALIFPGTDLILQLLSVPDEIYELMRSYVKIIFIGIGFTFLYNFFAYLLRSIGNSVVPLYFLAASSVMNIVLDLLFVISFRWGVPGAAIATVVSQGFSGLGIALYVMIHDGELLRPSSKPDVSRIGMIMKNDVLTGLQQSVMNLGILMIQGLVNSFGTTIMAAFAAAVKIDTLAYMPAQEFGNAYSLFISQNFGAKKEERIHSGSRIAIAVSAVFCVVISVVIWIFSGAYMQLFVDAGEKEIIAQGIHYLHIEGSFYFGIGILFLLYGFYRGIQKAGMMYYRILSDQTRCICRDGRLPFD
jgi:putative MATE family efflux protein